MPQRGNFFHLHLVSDATGETLITVARAAAAQYATVAPIEHIYPLVRTEKQLDRVIAEIETAPGIVLYTLLEETLTTRLEAKCREFGLPCLSILNPVLALFQSYLGAESTRRVGAQHTLNAEYFKRIDALNYTMLHDDGQHTDDLEHADVVLTGVSRTSKTPTSIYLANRGVKTANVPLVPNMPVPPNLERLTAPLVVGLTASPERIVQIRQNRLLGSERASRRRSVCRPPGGRRGDRVLAQALRAAQLAGDRRDAALDRGDGRRRAGAARRPAPAAGVVSLAHDLFRKPVPLSGSSRSLACPTSRWCSRRKARCAARCSKPPAFRSRRGRRISTSARSSRASAAVRARSR